MNKISCWMAVFVILTWAIPAHAEQIPCSLTIVVKSQTNGVPIGGAKISVLREGYQKSWGKWWNAKEFQMVTDGNGEAKNNSWELIGSGVARKCSFTHSPKWEGQDRKWRFSVTVEAPSFKAAQNEAIMNRDQPNPTAYVYLVPSL